MKRKVEVFKRSYPQGYNTPPVISHVADGLFHCWGQEYEEFAEGPGNFTVAIIELEDGSIITPHPTDIRFIDK